MPATVIFELRLVLEPDEVSHSPEFLADLPKKLEANYDTATHRFTVGTVRLHGHDSDDHGQNKVTAEVTGFFEKKTSTGLKREATPST